MANTIKNGYGNSNVTIPCSFANTAALHGRLSAPIDNTVNLYQEAMFQCKVFTGAAAPSGNKQIQVYGLASLNVGAAGVIYTDGYAPGDNDSGVPVNTARPIMTIPTVLANKDYYGGPIAVSVAFGNVLPQSWMIYVWNDHGQAVANNSAFHWFIHQGVYTTYT